MDARAPCVPAKILVPSCGSFKISDERASYFYSRVSPGQLYCNVCASITSFVVVLLNFLDLWLKWMDKTSVISSIYDFLENET